MHQLHRCVWNPAEAPPEIAAMLATLAEEYPLYTSGRGTRLRFRRLEAGGMRVRVTRSGGVGMVEYGCIAAAARGVGDLLAGQSGESVCPFATLSAKLDMARGAVFRVDHLKRWLRRLALCGCNLVRIMAPDVIELEGEPYFGYMRGNYTRKDLQELDEYASRLGIELSAMMQGLGHMEQILRWPIYREVRDTPSVLLVDAPETRVLLEKIVDFWSGSLRSRRLYIGFDETHDLGRGKFLDLHGFERGFDIFVRHLKLVTAMCRERGITPMISSDMFFRMCNPEHRYDDVGSEVPEEVRRELPPDLELNYWDYHHDDVDHYVRMIRRHREYFQRDPIVSTALWSWKRLWYDHATTCRKALPSIEACRQEGIAEYLINIFGDDGATNCFDSTLFGYFYLTSRIWTPAQPDLGIYRRFEAICGSSARAQLLASQLTLTLPESGDKPEMVVSPHPLVWDDPLLAIMLDDCERRRPGFTAETIKCYRRIAAQLRRYESENSAGSIAHAINICRLMAVRLELRAGLEKAYFSHDRKALARVRGKLLPVAIAAARDFIDSYRKMWMYANKPFGFEVITGRNGGMLLRLQEVGLRIDEYLGGNAEALTELDQRLPRNAPLYSLPWGVTSQVLSGSIWIL